MWLVERQGPTLEQWWFAVQVAICGAGVIPPKLKSRLPSKSSSVNTSVVIDLMVSEGMRAWPDSVLRDNVHPAHNYCKIFAVATSYLHEYCYCACSQIFTGPLIAFIVSCRVHVLSRESGYAQISLPMLCVRTFTLLLTKV